jgi:hypothetical protein
MPITVRILTAGTDDASCRIAIARMNDICEMSPRPSTFLPTYVCRAVCLIDGRALHQRQTAASTSLYGIMKCGIQLARNNALLLDGHHSISRWRPAHIAAVGIAGPTLTNATVGRHDSSCRYLERRPQILAIPTILRPWIPQSSGAL